MIRAGYGKDPDNKSFGKYFDIERAFHGYPGPLTNSLNHMFDGHKMNNIYGKKISSSHSKVS